jgi:hypothetical protein
LDNIKNDIEEIKDLLKQFLNKWLPSEMI